MRGRGRRSEGIQGGVEEAREEGSLWGFREELRTTGRPGRCRIEIIRGGED